MFVRTRSLATKDTSRAVTRLVTAQEKQEGSGAMVKRSVGIRGNHDLDPFLLLDRFSFHHPNGFPMHPHRGFSTLTYVLQGGVTHEDNRGNKGTVLPGGAQLMVAAGGIVHSETAGSTQGVNEGLQLWINLPKSHKSNPACWVDVSPEAVVGLEPVAGVTARILAGVWDKVEGALNMDQTIVPILYFDLNMAPGTAVDVPVSAAYDTAFVYVVQGDGTLVSDQHVHKDQLALLDTQADAVSLHNSSSTHHARAVVVAGSSIGEPIAAGGLFVMNTWEEVEQAYQEFRDGKF